MFYNIFGIKYLKYGLGMKYLKFKHFDVPKFCKTEADFVPQILSFHMVVSK